MASLAYEYRGIDLDKMEEIAHAGHSFEWQVYLAAKEYAWAGMFVVPLAKGSKALPRREHNVNYGHASNSSKTISKWFHPEKGKFAGYNIGIATGRTGGVFVVDIDAKGEVNGFETLEELEAEHGELPEGPVQQTPNGGEHRIFLWQDNAASSTGKIGPGIDTRGGEEAQCKGHIVAFPSTVKGQRYEWVRGGPVPLIPRWVMERMGVAWRHVKMTTGRGLEEVDINSQEIQITLDQVKRMLESIDPDELSYDEWLRVGMAIKSQYPGDDGMEAWDQWSQRGDRYQRDECRIRWNGFDEGGTVRMATLFYFAKNAGWEPEKQDIRPSKLAMVVERMNNTYAIVPVGGKIRILREREIAADPIAGHYDLMDKESFRTLHQNDVIMTEGEKPKPITAADLWLGAEFRRTYINGLKLCPPGTHCPPGTYNTWAGFSVEPRKGHCSLFLDHLLKVVCQNDRDLYEWLLDWCADLVQDPGDPKGCAIVMRGKEGIGKGTFANTVGTLFGPHYLHLIDDSHLTSNFNAHLVDTIITYADEITWGGNKRTAGKLKGIVTEKFLVAERKGVDAVGYRNMNHLIIASNNDWVIPAGTSSRRWFVLDVSDEHANDHPYFHEIHDQLDNGGREALLHMLMNRAITHELRQAPETEALQDQRDRSSDNTIHQWWARCESRGAIDVMDLDTDTIGVWPTTVSKEDLYDVYEQFCLDRKIRAEHPAVFAKEMRYLGATTSRITHANKRVRVFIIPALEDDNA